MAQNPSREIVELLLDTEANNSERTKKNWEDSIAGVLVGVLARCDNPGQGWVSFDQRSVDSPIVARTLQLIGKDDIGRQVCLMFEQGDSTKPIILGFLQTKNTKGEDLISGQRGETFESIEARVDGERILLEAHKEIVLKCGKASITLTQDGRVLVRGTYLSSRSTGPNLIKGGSVQLN